MIFGLLLSHRVFAREKFSFLFFFFVLVGKGGSFKRILSKNGVFFGSEVMRREIKDRGSVALFYSRGWGIVSERKVGIEGCFNHSNNYLLYLEEYGMIVTCKEKILKIYFSQK